MTETNRIELNGQAKGKSKAKRKPSQTQRRAMMARQPKLALLLTVSMGIAIPLLSLALSSIAGTLARTAHPYLAGSGLALTVSVLTVSLSHLSWSVADITKSGRWASWALAATVDLAIVLCESVHVFAEDSGIDLLATSVMVCVTLASMALNVWAFLRHR